MTTMHKTQNRVPSSHPKDFHDNSIVVDNFCNSKERCVETRTGESIRTLSGINCDAQDAIDGFDQLINDKVLAQGGVEIANEFGDSDEKAISQLLATNTQEKLDLLMKNSVLIASALDNLKQNNAVDIVCVGDSITYGYDENSPDKLPPLAGHIRHRAPIQYPMQLEKELKRIYSSENISVKNYGYSGDTVKTSFNRDMWKVDPKCNLAIIMFGINDQTQKLPISEYVEYLEKWIKRLNSWGCGVIIATSTLVAGGGIAKKIDGYRFAATQVAQLLGCPIFTTSDFVVNYKREEIYSNATHFNKEGYKILGNTFAWFIANGCMYRKISSHTLLQPTEENCVTDGDRYNTDSSYSTNEFQLRLFSNKNQKVTFPFYLDGEAAEIEISGYLGEKTEIIINSDNLRSTTQIKGGARTTANYQVFADEVSYPYNESKMIATIIGRGWHAITITSPAYTSSENFGSYVNALKIQVIEEQELRSHDVHRVDKRVCVMFDPPLHNRHEELAASSQTIFKVPTFHVSKTYAGTLRWASTMPFRVVIVGAIYGKGTHMSECIVQFYNSKFVITPIFKSSNFATELISVDADNRENIQLTLKREDANRIKIIIESYDSSYSQSLIAQ